MCLFRCEAWQRDRLASDTRILMGSIVTCSVTGRWVGTVGLGCSLEVEGRRVAGVLFLVRRAVIRTGH